MKCQTPSNPIKLWGQNPSYGEANGEKNHLGRKLPTIISYLHSAMDYVEPWLGEWIFSGYSNTGCQDTQQILLHEFWKAGVFKLSLHLLASFQECNFKITITYLLQKDTCDHELSWGIYSTNEERQAEIK